MKQKLMLVSLLFLASIAYPQTQYFPPGAFCTPHETEHCDRWYAPHLVAMKEPSLWELSKKQPDEMYRFLWLRTFHHPVSARLEIAPDGSGELVVKVLSGAGGYNPGHIIHNRKIRVQKEGVDHLLELLNKAGFWDLPTEQEINGVGCDGAQWIMEGSRNGQYHIVDRWSPDEGAYRKAALFLVINLGGLNPRYNDVY